MPGPVFNSATNGTSTGVAAVISVAFNNVAGDYLYVWVYDEWFAANVVSVTYNGVGCTKILEKTLDGQRYASLWRLASPATGSHTLQATRTTAIGSFSFNALTISNADPLGPEATGFKQEGSMVSTTTLSVTSVSANALIIAGAATAIGAVSTTAPGTQRASLNSMALSTQPAATPGVQSVVFTQTGSWFWASIAVAHAGATPPSTPWLYRNPTTMLGAGIS